MNELPKFKAKRLDNGQWVYGNYFKTPLTDENSGCPMEAGWFFLSDGKTRHCISDENGVTYVINIKTLCQFTDKYDKNSKEIYKNDIVYAHMNNRYYLVSHGLYSNMEIDRDGENPDCYGWFIKWKDEDLYGESLEGSDKWLSVVGNNYDNPEILK